MNSLVKFVVASALGVFVLKANAQQSCYDKIAIKSPATYSIVFESALKLEQNESGNYSAKLQNGRLFGCDIFSITPTLEGRYISAQAERLNVKPGEACSVKAAYEYTQFVNESGEPVFRLQCAMPPFEDQQPEPFAPSAINARTINFGVRTRVLQ